MTAFVSHVIYIQDKRVFDSMNVKMNPVHLEVKDLCKYYPLKGGFFEANRMVAGGLLVKNKEKIGQLRQFV